MMLAHRWWCAKLIINHIFQELKLQDHGSVCDVSINMWQRTQENVNTARVIVTSPCGGYYNGFNVWNNCLTFWGKNQILHNQLEHREAF